MPNDSFNYYDAIAPVQAYQIIQKSLTEMELRLVIERSLTPE